MMAVVNEIELTPGELRELLAAAMDRVEAYLEGLESQPMKVLDTAPAVCEELVESAPRTGAPVDELFDLLFGPASSVGFASASPGYIAYIPGGGILHAAVGDFVANALNRYVGVWAAAPGMVQLETNVVRWFCELVGYPESSLGFLTTGGSLANLSAVTTARSEKLGEQFLNGTLYVSDQGHHSLAKAAMLAGFPRANLRTIPSDARQRIRVDLLEQAIAEDRERGRHPALVMANAGTTNTGAIDDLHAIADVCAEQGLWMHADAAYGGFFLLTRRGRERLRGIERADSVTLDPHKGLFLPFGTGALLVRDGEALRRTHSVTSDYMPAYQDVHGHVDYAEISPELSRDFRGLRVWLPLRLCGLDRFEAFLDEKLDLAEYAAQRLRALPDVEVLEPQLSVVAFRWCPEGMETEAANERNQGWLDRVNARQRVLLTPTVLDGVYVLRIAVLAFRTHRDRIDLALEDIEQTMEGL